MRILYGEVGQRWAELGAFTERAGDGRKGERGQAKEVNIHLDEFAVGEGV